MCEPNVRAACQGQGGCFDFRAAIVFEVAPSPLCHLERGAIKPRPVQDPENPCGGHRIPPLRVNEAGDDRTLACIEPYDATQSLWQAVQASESPRRLLRDVLRYIPEGGGANLFVRPIRGIHDAIFDWVPIPERISASPIATAHGRIEKNLTYYMDFIEFI